MNLRDTMAADLPHLIGQLPVYCGASQQTQTIPCAWLSQRDEVRFASPGLLNADSAQIIACAADFPAVPAEHSVFWVSGHRYRIQLVEKIDCVSLRITLARSDK